MFVYLNSLDVVVKGSFTCYIQFGSWDRLAGIQKVKPVLIQTDPSFESRENRNVDMGNVNLWGLTCSKPETHFELLHWLNYLLLVWVRSCSRTATVLAEQLDCWDFETDFQRVVKDNFELKSFVSVPIKVGIHIMAVFLSHRLRVNPTGSLFNPGSNDEQVFLPLRHELFFLFHTNV